MNYKELLEKARIVLTEAAIENAEYDAWILMEEVFKINRSQYYMKMCDQVDTDKSNNYLVMIQKRAKHIPLQYLLGQWAFMGLPFKVNQNVLIPRADTEVLVEETLKIAKMAVKPVGILDMCTGSGCIGISLAKFVPESSVKAVDLSKGALEVAEENAVLNNVQNIEFICSDLFENVSGKFQIIVSNPPYIESEEIQKLMPEVREFEPILALDGDLDGLKFYRKIIHECGNYLEKNGYLIFEIGCNQANAVSEILKDHGFNHIRVVKDLPGLDRVVIAENGGN